MEVMILKVSLLIIFLFLIPNMKKLLFSLLLSFFLSGNLFAQGGGAGVNVKSEAQHPLRHRANRILVDDTGGYYVGSDVETALTEIATGLTVAPKDADYLVGTINTSLTNEIVAGTSPGGELGNTWASPTIDTTHSGSAHHSAITMSGTPDYITLTGQDIVRGKADISDDTNFAVISPIVLTDDTVSMPVATTTASGYIVTTDWNSWTNHVADNSQAHSDYMLNTGDTSTGDYNFTAGNLTTTGTLGAGATILTSSLTATGITVTNGAIASGIIVIKEDTDDGAQYASFTVPALTANTNYTLPTDDGAVSEVLSTDGSGILDWVAAGAGDITTVGDVITGAAFDGTQGNTLTFKGATSGTTALKPTAIAGTTTITMPAETGTVLTSATTFAGDVTGTSGATVVGDESHAHTTTTISGIDISADTNLAGDTEIVLTGDALSIASGITRDTEWDTAAEINTATTDADFLTAEVDGSITNEAPTTATYITQTADGTLSAEQALSTLATGLMQVTTTTGAITSVTTSAGVSGLLSDETGSGVLVFGTSPTFTTKIISPEVENAGNITIDAVNAAANSTVTVTNSDATYKANLSVEGNALAATYGSDGSITDAELLYINTLSSNAQTQISAKGDMSYANARFKVGSFTRDVTAASGDVAYTGVGFTPTAIIFMGGVGDATLNYLSWSFTDGTTSGVLRTYANTGIYDTASGQVVSLIEASGKGQTALLSSFGADGFTLTWTKIGTPAAGTGTTKYIAFR